MSYPRIIAAISDELRHRYGTSSRPIAAADDIVDRIIATQRAMPDFLRVAVTLLTWGFDCWGLVTSGVRFRNMPAELRRQQLDAWKTSRLHMCRNFVRFYENLFFLIAIEESPQ